MGFTLYPENVTLNQADSTSENLITNFPVDEVISLKMLVKLLVFISVYL